MQRRPLMVLFAALAGCAAPTTPEITVDFVVAEDGVQLSVLEAHGPADGPTLFFLHGWCCDFDTWNEQIPVFASRGYRVVAMDYAGHGTSMGEREAWSIEQFGSDVARVAEQLDLRNLIVVGHSMGGAVAIEAAVRMPERMRLLVAADSLHDFDYREEDDVVDSVLSALGEDFSGTMANLVGSMFVEDSDPAIRARMVDSMARADPTCGIALFRAYLGYPFEERAQRLEVPVVAILAPDYPADVDGNRRIVPEYEAHVIPGSDHFLMMGKPRAFNARLQEVLDDRGLVPR